jgi:hypothetical protein
MDENQGVVHVQVSELRKMYKSLLQEKKPLVLRTNSRIVGILLCVGSSYYGTIEHPRKEGRRLRAELEAVLKQISGR